MKENLFLYADVKTLHISFALYENDLSTVTTHYYKRFFTAWKKPYCFILCHRACMWDLKNNKKTGRNQCFSHECGFSINFFHLCSLVAPSSGHITIALCKFLRIHHRIDDLLPATLLYKSFPLEFKWNPQNHHHLLSWQEQHRLDVGFCS